MDQEHDRTAVWLTVIDALLAELRAPRVPTLASPPRPPHQCPVRPQVAGPGRTRSRRGVAPSRWLIDDEADVQALLWTILAPAYGPDLVDETYLPHTGQVQPRADLAILSLRLIIEVKFLRTPADFRAVEEQVAGTAGSTSASRGASIGWSPSSTTTATGRNPSGTRIGDGAEAAGTDGGSSDRAPTEHDPRSRRADLGAANDGSGSSGCPLCRRSRSSSSARGFGQCPPFRRFDRRSSALLGAPPGVPVPEGDCTAGPNLRQQLSSRVAGLAPLLPTSCEQGCAWGQAAHSLASLSSGGGYGSRHGNSTIEGLARDATKIGPGLNPPHIVYV